MIRRKNKLWDVVRLSRQWNLNNECWDLVETIKMFSLRQDADQYLKEHCKEYKNDTKENPLERYWIRYEIREWR